MAFSQVECSLFPNLYQVMGQGSFFKKKRGMTEFESNSGVRGRKGHQNKIDLIKCFEMSLNLPHLRVNFKNPCKAIVQFGSRFSVYRPIKWGFISKLFKKAFFCNLGFQVLSCLTFKLIWVQTCFAFGEITDPAQRVLERLTCVLFVSCRIRCCRFI